MENNKVKQNSEDKLRNVRHFINQALTIAGGAGFGVAYIYLSGIIAKDVCNNWAQHGMNSSIYGESALGLLIYGMGIAHVYGAARCVRQVYDARRKNSKQR